MPSPARSTPYQNQASRWSDERKESDAPSKEVSSRSALGLAEGYRSPERYYQLVVKNGKLKVEFSPGFKKSKIKNVVYIWKGETRSKCYIGLTSQDAAKRVKQHLAKAMKHPTTKFHRALIENPTAFKFGIISSLRSPTRLPAVERQLIKELKPGLNSVAGGGGISIARDSSASASEESIASSSRKLEFGHLVVDPTEKEID